MSTFAKSSKVKLPTLTEASEYQRWRSALQMRLFRQQLPKLEHLTTAGTLDPSFFKKEYKDDYNAAGKDANNNPTKPLSDDNPAFLAKCIGRAFQTGEGFQPWLYELYADVQNALSDIIQEQTSGVTPGDLIGLLSAIKLALHHYEISSPEALEIDYAKCSMEHEGKNDLMTYIAKLANFRERLAGAGVIRNDAKDQRILLNGLNPDIFNIFIFNAKRHPYGSYGNLVKAVEETAMDPRMLRGPEARQDANNNGNAGHPGLPANGQARGYDSRPRPQRPAQKAKWEAKRVAKHKEPSQHLLHLRNRKMRQAELSIQPYQELS
jgi:hypothetical protein